MRDEEASKVAALRRALAALHSRVDETMGDSDLELDDPLTLAMHDAARALNHVEGKRYQGGEGE